MRIKNWKSLFAVPLLLASCAGEPDTAPSKGTISVSIGSAPKVDIELSSADTRTDIGEDGVSIKWETNDKIAVWAVGSLGTTQLDAHPFRMWHYNAAFSEAKFTADITPMPEDTYTYYATYPVPASHSGTVANYTLPSTQDGTFDGNLDVMVAAPIEAPALQSGDNSDDISFRFSHKVHVLRITIPSNNLGHQVTELEMTFPVPVTGTLSVDAADPNAAPVLSGGSNKLSLVFDEPVDVGSTVYAFIAPVNIDPSAQIAIKAFGATCESNTAYMAGKDFAAGHTTPIKLNVPSLGADFTLINFALPADGGTSTLGEQVTSVTLTAPAGVTFDNGSNIRTFTPDANGKYTIICRTDWTNNLSGQAVTVSYESENAIVSNSVTMPTITTAAVNDIAAFDVPYLLFEDFSGANSSVAGDENANSTSAGRELTNAGLPGWYAYSRMQITTGVSVTLRSYSNLLGPYHSGFRSCALSGLKSDKTVTVTLKFNADWDKNKSSSMGLIVGWTTGTALNSTITGGSTISLADNSSANANNIPTLRTLNITGVTSAAGIAWKTAGKNGTMFNYDNIYIDNIRVSIAQ